MHIFREPRRLARGLCSTEGREDILVIKDLKKLWVGEISAPLKAEEASLINIQRNVVPPKKDGPEDSTCQAEARKW